MIIINLRGGLGNQMFQYAFGRQLPLERSAPLKSDVSWFQTQNRHRYRFDQLEIDANYQQESSKYNIGPHKTLAGFAFTHALSTFFITLGFPGAILSHLRVGTQK